MQTRFTSRRESNSEAEVWSGAKIVRAPQLRRDLGQTSVVSGETTTRDERGRRWSLERPPSSTLAAAWGAPPARTSAGRPGGRGAARQSHGLGLRCALASLMHKLIAASLLLALTACGGGDHTTEFAETREAACVPGRIWWDEADCADNCRGLCFQFDDEPCGGEIEGYWGCAELPWLM